MPLTRDGPIVVNSIHASSNVSIMDHTPAIVTQCKNVISEAQLLHWWLVPYRMICLGISIKYCSNEYSLNEDGIAYWLAVGKYVASVGNDWWLSFKMLGIVVFGMFMVVYMVGTLGL